MHSTPRRCAHTKPPPPQSPRPGALPDHADSQACLHLFVTISICANLMCTASTTFVSVWGSGKALRGKVHSAHGGLRTRPTLLPPYPASLAPLPNSRPDPQDGSMFEAVDGMNDERAFIFTCFGAPLHANPHARGTRTQPGGPGLTQPSPNVRCGTHHDTTRTHVCRMDPDDARGCVCGAPPAPRLPHPALRGPCRNASHPQPPLHPRRQRVASRGAYTS